MNLIGKKVFENNVFMQCDCGEEIIEFCRDSSISNDNTVEYFIQYHGYFSYKVDKCNSFFFLNKSEFSLFLDEIRDFLNGVEKNVSAVFFDKYLTYKNKFPGTLIVTYDNSMGYFYIIKYPNPTEAKKAGKCSWEIIIGKEQAKELLEELEEWR